MKLEYVESLIIAHPFIKGFDQEVYCLTDEEVRAVAEAETSPAVLKRKKEDCEGNEGRIIYTTTFYIGLAVEPKQRQPSVSWISWHLAHTGHSPAGQQGPRKLDISYPTNEFVKMVKTWDKYDNATMGVVVQNIRRYYRSFGSRHYWMLTSPPDRCCRTGSLTRVRSRSPLSKGRIQR